ncbi:hypothetical protein ABZ793_33025 [Micromonospora sp. NPDC047465]|uniref:hypothetical protein n=1 Tax=Micromonospora sp. NPDC047465 TaxID=3154813 RepID=UPI0033F31B8F
MTDTAPTAFDKLDDATAEAILYGEALDAVTADRERETRRRAELEARLGWAWGRVEQLHRLLTVAEAARDRYRHQVDLADAERARLAEELAAVRAAANGAGPVIDLAACRRCGCTEARACLGGCGWATGAEQLAVGLDPMEGDLCTACLQDRIRERDRARPWWQRMFRR